MADLARGYQGELKQRYDRPLWHYINMPYYLSRADREALESEITVNLSLQPPATPETDMNVVQAIRYARGVLSDDQAEKSEKALMLAWLFHTVGDLHQPLHSTALFSRKLFRIGDKGGNAVITQQRGTLHSLWDNLPGSSGDYRRARNLAIEFVNDEEQKVAGQAAAEQLDEEQWLDESYDLAITRVYSQEVLSPLRAMEEQGDTGEFPPIDLSEEYLERGGETCDRRLVEAGYRLVALLKEIANQ